MSDQKKTDRSEDSKVFTFSPQLQSVISEILPSEDPLDSPAFNSVDYINGMFPNEQSLVDLDTAIAKLKGRISRTDEEILKSVREQVSSGSKGKQSLEESKKAIRDLFSKINDIKAKAEQSEKMVTEICRDIKSLDYAKRNLTATITALKRLHMLVTAVDQLKVMSTKKQYREAGQLLEAVNQLALHFAEYKHIPKINDMTKDVNQIMDDLKSQIYKEFTQFWDSPGTVAPGPLADACIVIDALGKNVKKDFMSWFVNRMLGEHNRFFRKGEESANLEHIERRFAWLKRTFVIYDEQYSKIFPENWRMPELLCEEFCFTTRQSLVDILEEGRHTMKVEVLVAAIKKTKAFEKELSERFGSQTAEVIVEMVPDQEGDEINVDDEEPAPNMESDPQLLNPHSSAAIKARYKKFQKEEEKKKKAQLTKPQQREIQKFQGIISSSFDLYMDLYIKNEDEKMHEMLEKVISEETWSVDDDERNKVLSSSTDLVYYFMTAMKMCSSLTKNQAFYDLYSLFKKYLEQYADIITDKIPSADAKLSEQQEKLLCLIVNTADYCSQTTIGMTTTLRNMINPRFSEKIDLTSEQNKFENVIAKALKRLENGLESKLEPALLQMTRMPWGSWESVEDQSDYVNQISTYINQSVPLYMNWLSHPEKGYFSHFCRSFCSSFVSLLILQIFKCRRISEVGAQQLMLDFTAIRAILADLPNGGKGTARVPGGYTRQLNKEMSKADLILKVILTPQATLVDTYKSLIPDGSESELQKIMDLKGISRSDQKAMLGTSATSLNTNRRFNMNFNVPDVFKGRQGGADPNSN